MLTYRTCRRTERIGSLAVELEALEDLNSTIDEMFVVLEREGRPELLEELCPYFGVVWPAARGLASYLAVRKEEFDGRDVLELGCGLALPSLVAARLGARVLATDCHPEVERFLRRNLELNGHPAIEFRQADWAAPDDAPRSFDWVIASDILYDRTYPEKVARAFATHLKPGGTALLADPGRPYLQTFAECMKRHGFSCDAQAQDDVCLLVLRRDMRAG